MLEQSNLELYADGAHPVSIGMITRYLEPSKSLMYQESDMKWCAISNERRPVAVIEIERNNHCKNWDEYVQRSDVDTYWIVPLKTLELGEKTDISESRLYARLREAKQTNVGQQAFEMYLLLLEVAEYEMYDDEKNRSTYKNKKRRNQGRNRKRHSEGQAAPSGA